MEAQDQPIGDRVAEAMAAYTTECAKAAEWEAVAVGMSVVQGKLFPLKVCLRDEGQHPWGTVRKVHTVLPRLLENCGSREVVGGT